MTNASSFIGASASSPRLPSKGSTSLQIKRIYEPKEASDGTRILVDRLWPRGLSKTAASVDIWLKEIAPSSELRRWFDHDPAKWDEFRARYDSELVQNASVVGTLMREIGRAKVTILYSAKDEEHNDAVALAQFIAARLS
ncbi:DUF488 domain-containing protein [Rhizobium sp. BK251]|uniref:DUF488 domain-containing protein n=1 Tax=Rhizobium sp. BK251 TaxID=2512125 RepID=UPI001044C61F|nr:DUF488 domain-containing protein [Rhizobium sp. BK251]TCL62898.1 uncharacterized protein YeaO (DUF488 family) [Rhizobium sp. BK251]